MMNATIPARAQTSLRLITDLVYAIAASNGAYQEHRIQNQLSRVQKRIAAMTPGTQAINVKIVVTTIAPQPLSSTASGGRRRQSIARKHPM